MAAVGARQGEIFEELWDSMIEHGAIVAAGLVTERGSEPGLADAGRANEDQVVMSLDPLPLDELLEQGPIETARASIIDIFGARLLAQLGVAQSRREPLILTP